MGFVGIKSCQPRHKSIKNIFLTHVNIWLIHDHPYHRDFSIVVCNSYDMNPFKMYLKIYLSKYIMFIYRCLIFCLMEYMYNVNNLEIQIILQWYVYLLHFATKRATSDYYEICKWSSLYGWLFLYKYDILLLYM